ncbi:MAG TPA: YciI family protein [Polyangiaceae bacterium]|nr:YciI family protein [Polyangiaceae bacterium]
MLFAILCYDSEQVVSSWSKEEDDRAMTKLGAVQAEWAARGKLGPVARLMPTSAATTLRKGRSQVVMDGPFAETKEQLLGFFVVDCASMDDAIESARELARCYSSDGAYEVRPISFFAPGALG